jgi:hypothetical protein
MSLDQYNKLSSLLKLEPKSADYKLALKMYNSFETCEKKVSLFYNYFNENTILLKNIITSPEYSHFTKEQLHFIIKNYAPYRTFRKTILKNQKNARYYYR